MDRPATLSAGFFAFMVVTVAKEGPFGFWADHTACMWGNQIWYDLLLAGALAFGALGKEASELGLNKPLWALATAASGSVGLLAMKARILYLQARV